MAKILTIVSNTILYEDEFVKQLNMYLDGARVKVMSMLTTQSEFWLLSNNSKHADAISMERKFRSILCLEYITLYTQRIIILL